MQSSYLTRDVGVISDDDDLNVLIWDGSIDLSIGRSVPSLLPDPRSTAWRVSYCST